MGNTKAAIFVFDTCTLERASRCHPLILFILTLMYLTPPLLLSAPPINLSLPGAAEGGAKKRLVAPTLSVTLSPKDPADLPADGFVALSSSFDETPSVDINLEALETPSDSESGTLPGSLHDLEWEGENENMDTWSTEVGD